MSAPEPGLAGPSLTFGGYAAQPGDLEGVGFWPRAAARAIDYVLHYITSYLTGGLFGAFVAIAATFAYGSENANAAVMHAVARMQGSPFLLMFASLVGSVVYETVCEAAHGSTLGKLALGMTVVQEDGSFCRWRSALVRSLGYFVDSLVFGLVGYLEMNKSPKEQRHGDNWAHTIVCKRSGLKPEQLRSTPRFIGVVVIALLLNGAALMSTLTLIVML